jgi:hypothetical protein
MSAEIGRNTHRNNTIQSHLSLYMNDTWILGTTLNTRLVFNCPLFA